MRQAANRCTRCGHTWSDYPGGFALHVWIWRWTPKGHQLLRREHPDAVFIDAPGREDIILGQLCEKCGSRYFVAA